MKSICITGALESDLQFVAGVLTRAGMNPALPAQRDDPIDLAVWHRQVMDLAPEADASEQQIGNPGRLWDQIASDIFLANINSGVWGWADTASTWLLDYWLDFDPSLHFVLVCTTPEQMLASEMMAGTEGVSVAEIMDAWHHHHQELLRFHHRNPQRSLLVAARDCVDDPGALVECCASRWKISLALPGDSPARPAGPDRLALYLAHQLGREFPAMASLQHELAATITPLVPSSAELDATQTIPDSAQIITDYRVLHDRSAEQREVQAARDDLAELKTRLEDTIAAAAQKQRELENTLDAVNRENDGTLLQLHQLHDTLDSARMQAAAAQQQIELLSSERDGHATFAAQLQAQVGNLTQANALLADEKSALVARRDELERHATELGMARDDHARLAAERQVQIDSLVQERSTLLARRDELERHATELGMARDEFARLEAEATAKVAEYVEENQLLLLQLHQAQEELETVLLKGEEAKKELDLLAQARNEQARLAAERQTRIEALLQERDSQAALAAERQARIEALTQNAAVLVQEQSALTSHRNQLQQEVAALTQARDDQGRLTAKARSELEEAVQKNGLLTSQLHQIQEELEAVFLKGEEEKKELAILAQARKEQAELAIDAQKKFDAVRVEIEQAKKEIETQAQRSTKLAEERAALAACNEVLEREAADFARAREELQRIAAEAQHRIADANRENDLLRLQLDQLQQEFETRFLTNDAGARERELLQLQQRQVEAELEHQNLQQRELQAQLNAAEARWQRMLRRSPDYCDYESIEVPHAEGGERSLASWRIHDFNTVGRTLPELEFKTVIEHGIAGIVLHRLPGGTGPLLRWPGNAATVDEITLLPAGTRETFPQRIETLFDLATRDWDLLYPLPRLLARVLRNPAPLNAPQSLHAEALREAMGRFAELMQKFPATLRYDVVRLRNEQVNPDYEHLWLRFENLAFGGQRLPEFEFRLSCAHVRPDSFGTHPKLEFPEESGRAPFEAWFVESHDDLGAKLELRFAQPDAMDMAVWHRLSASDHAFLTGLVKRLPAILGNLQRAGLILRRPWEDWIRMAREVQRILVLRTTPQVPAAALPPAAPAPAAAGPVPAPAKATKAAKPKPTAPGAVATRQTGKAARPAKSTQAAGTGKSVKSAKPAKSAKAGKTR